MYEYKLVEANKSNVTKVMNMHAKEGWRVVSNSHYYNWGHAFYITFEREIDNNNLKDEFEK